MARIKIVDLPGDVKISKEEMKKVIGGKVRVGQPKDIYEREADEVADSILQAVARITAS